ncbi:MAG: hypothetical protein R6X02_32525 [Enhygromyxa sp.]
MTRGAWIAAALLLGSASGCWPGRCGGALRGTPMVAFTGEHAPCTEGPSCAELISPERGFRQKGDYARVDDPSVLLAESGVDSRTWFLVDERDAIVPSRVEAIQHSSAHSCASAVGFELRPDAPLEPGVYRLVLLVERVRWPLLRGSVALSSWAGEPALVQYYRVEAPG